MPPSGLFWALENASFLHEGGRSGRRRSRTGRTLLPQSGTTLIECFEYNHLKVVSAGQALGGASPVFFFDATRFHETIGFEVQGQGAIYIC